MDVAGVIVDGRVALAGRCFGGVILGVKERYKNI